MKGKYFSGCPQGFLSKEVFGSDRPYILHYTLHTLLSSYVLSLLYTPSLMDRICLVSME